MSDISDFLNAIMGQESGGNYRAVNRYTGALGLYQVLPGNVGPWAQKYLGMNVTPTQYLNNASLQTRLVTAVMSDYVRRYGYRGAASAWYSGNPALANNYNPQKYGPSIGEYVDQVMQRMDQSPGAVAAHALTDAFGGARMGLGEKPKATEPMQQTMVTNEIAEDRDEPDAVKGLGLSIEDGLGQGQLGLEAPAGPEAKDVQLLGQDEPLGLASLTGPVSAFNAPQAQPLPAKSEGFGLMTGANIGSTMGIGNPLPGFKVTFGFGAKYAHAGHPAGDYHLGIDFAAPMGTRIFSPVGGRIVSAGWESGGFGLAIRIQNSDGTYTILGHLSSLAGLKPGQSITRGMFLGRVGATGDADGSHLHMEMRRKLYDKSTAFDFTDNIEW